jgi:hypothetical protein
LGEGCVGVQYFFGTRSIVRPPPEPSPLIEITITSPAVQWLPYLGTLSGMETVAFLPLWIPALLFTVFTRATLRNHRRHAERARAGQCVRCGYSRLGLANSTQCPECGAPAHPHADP